MSARPDDLLVAHVVWAVKQRLPLLLAGDDESLHVLLHAKANDVGAMLLAVGSASDHVHVVVRFPAARPLSEIVQRLKGASSRVLGLKHPNEAFAWQDGFWARTCAPDGIDDLLRYVQNQRDHHEHGSAPEPWEHAANIPEIMTRPGRDRR